MEITQTAATWFLPFVLPICLWVAYTDLKLMKILNIAVLALIAVFVVIGLFALPFPDYLWRYAHFGLILVLGVGLNAAGLVGAGDAKFAAAAAPLVALGDIRLVLVILAFSLLAGLAAHRLGKHTRLRNLAPDWESWHREGKYPMGLSLGGALAIYLGLGVFYGA
ncbi:prepilin peptidase [Roseovarius sp. C7]|uniref:prepilin peptidase n=1 Tax=Roseovarius sp. C7 TaxID=3398643 RepID=UPI0039F666E0